MIATSFTPAQWLILIGTMFTGVGTIITAWAGIVRAKKEVRTEQEILCLDRLKVARLESESLADELHTLRMKQREA